MNCLRADSNQDLNQVFEQGQHVLCITNAQMSSTGKIAIAEGEGVTRLHDIPPERERMKKKILEVCMQALP
jgi:hypothetical protein